MYEKLLSTAMELLPLKMGSLKVAVLIVLLGLSVSFLVKLYQHRRMVKGFVSAFLLVWQYPLILRSAIKHPTTSSSGTS